MPPELEQEQRDFEEAKAQNEKIRSLYRHTDSKLQKAEDQLSWYQRQIFGTRSDKFIPIPPEQQRLADLLQAVPMGSATAR